MPLKKTLGVLIGFPVIATLISLLLLNRTLLTDLGVDFSNTFRIIVIGWYIAQLFILSKILRSEGWSWQDIGYSLNTRKTMYSVLGYLVFTVGLLVLIDYTLANSVVDSEKLKSIVGLSPVDTTGRIIFIVLAFVAGISEEFVYRGFAINALIANKVNKWIAVVMASVPFFFQHGIKAYQLTWGTWYFAWGVVFGCLFLLLKNLNVNIVIHWLVILSAMVAILQAVK